MSNLAEKITEFTVVKVDRLGEECDRTLKKTIYQIEHLTEDIPLELVPLTGSNFLMGAPETEIGANSTQTPQHQVTVAAFSIGKYPVTQAQWLTVAAFPQVNLPLQANPSCFAGDELPVEQISWFEAIEFCARLSQHTGRNYRLPSEAEWEYACRGGTTTPFHFGETITTDFANYSGVNWQYDGRIISRGAYGAGSEGEDRKETTPVASFGVANDFGLSDLHGNVWEWCADYWHNNYQEAFNNGKPSSEADNNFRPLRGGSWNTGPNACRSAYRKKYQADANLYNIGFRVCFS
ncbi:formylglycine-generating enzyme family protein [Oscillatoria salina]|uniref:formylglycine-generating enzyme family protein n=1 Tax=Oscillatoria salina TaxID=331517 RepID=UPI0013BD29F6|nr:formylglycine-generating enzyme family protein [Oscillatoria salina]MBZ8183066.1 formylglycine-generating enzyme family protein [Oscillatoria salina IIICB1]NET90503.1 formylglycine-generating enzyme family protein [Kamptonema sp. SIO1D9]